MPPRWKQSRLKRAKRSKSRKRLFQLSKIKLKKRLPLPPMRDLSPRNSPPRLTRARKPQRRKKKRKLSLERKRRKLEEDEQTETLRLHNLLFK